MINIQPRDPSKPKQKKPKKFRFTYAGFRRDIIMVVHPEGTIELREHRTSRVYRTTAAALFVRIVKETVEDDMTDRQSRRQSRKFRSL